MYRRDLSMLFFQASSAILAPASFYCQDFDSLVRRSFADIPDCARIMGNKFDYSGLRI